MADWFGKARDSAKTNSDSRSMDLTGTITRLYNLVMRSPTSEAYGEMQRVYDVLNNELFSGQLPNCLITFQRAKRTFGYYSPRRFKDRVGNNSDEIALNPEFFSLFPPIMVIQTLAHEMVHLWQRHFGGQARELNSQSTKRRKYHDAKWGKKMIDIGLMPSSTGRPGGKTVGEHMCEYPIENGRFLLIAQKIVSKEIRHLWYDRIIEEENKRASRQMQEAASQSSVSITTNNTAERELSSAREALTQDDDLIYHEANPPRVIESINAFMTLKPQTRVKYQCPTCRTNVWGKKGIDILCGACNLRFENVDKDEAKEG